MIARSSGSTGCFRQSTTTPSEENPSTTTAATSTACPEIVSPEAKEQVPHCRPLKELAGGMSPKAGIGWRAHVLEVSLSQVSKHMKKNQKRDGCVNGTVEAFWFKPGP